MIHFQPERQNQLRRACDRCHQSKSKCFRDNDNESCQRCLRANIGCVSSPPASRRHAQAASREVLKPTPLGSVTSALHPSGQSLENGLSTSRVIAKSCPAASSSAVNGYQPSPIGESSSPTQEPVCDLISLLQKLSDLNINLMSQLSTIPEINPNSTDSSPFQPERTKLFSIDQTFNLSQVFIDVMSQLCLGLPPSHSDTPGQTAEAKRTLFSLDPASELLIFSTYLHLIETHDRILRLMKDSAKNREPDSPIRYPFQIPDFTIGSFSLPTQTDTQSFILLNIMDTMIARARGVVAEATTPKQTIGYRGDFQSFGGVTLVIVPDLARSAIRVREDSLVEMIKDLQNHIFQSTI
ncbi:uncharacterized protein GGS22DRAFT_28837 [Annulohypoxylon maeteangense]|uniref:uncharacterized protein n=1 Tax=Annulohypoxylon maeteangense TaxID=1927788 RepID=UPI002007EA0B|nr:uncharacterized protein GGS22DRAFT_28837 [Annulohypoxylon maeteangense]KAI0884010.1 hypothetical protein GGS22DRAFT_28837 [Annulohypoxylon maeteangense]